MRRAIFADRDGVLNAAIVANDRAMSPQTVDQFEVLAGVSESTLRAHDDGWLLVVVTNQPEVERGTLTLEVLESMHARLLAVAHIDLIKVCPHDASAGCDCRKPLPGMLTSAARELRVDLEQSWMIGDRWIDIAAGKAAGTSTALVERSYNWQVTSSDSPGRDLAPDLRVADLQGAVKYILEH